MCIPSIEARSTERGYESIVKYCFFIVLVLIDTWWNVNAVNAIPSNISLLVLIDTWWNVNRDMIRIVFDAETCFNRYMVECELVKIQFNGNCV